MNREGLSHDLNDASRSDPPLGSQRSFSKRTKAIIVATLAGLLILGFGLILQSANSKISQVSKTDPLSPSHSRIHSHASHSQPSNQLKDPKGSFENFSSRAIAVLGSKRRFYFALVAVGFLIAGLIVTVTLFTLHMKTHTSVPSEETPSTDPEKSSGTEPSPGHPQEGLDNTPHPSRLLRFYAGLFLVLISLGLNLLFIIFVTLFDENLKKNETFLDRFRSGHIGPFFYATIVLLIAGSIGSTVFSFCYPGVFTSYWDMEIIMAAYIALMTIYYGYDGYNRNSARQTTLA